MKLVAAITCKVSHNLFSYNLPIAKTKNESFLITLVYRQKIRQSSLQLVTDFEKLGAFQTLETLVRTQRHRVDVDEFSMFSGGGTWQEFRSDLDPCWFQ